MKWHAPREEPPQQTRAEDGVEQPECGTLADVHVVAVGQEEALPAERHDAGRGVDLHAAFARKVVAHPLVVVAREEEDPDAAVGHRRQPSERTDEAPGHHLAVLEPEVEDVAQQHHRLGIGRNGVEPGDELPLDPAGDLGAASAQMDIGCEVDHAKR